ncbi:MAG: ABC transporter permease [Bacteroidetes bacterium]|nr:ABC transporter permease [Bacteroidota bacterium]
MLKNYWRIAWRNLLKHKGFSLINLAGLSIAFTCCLLMFLYIHHERSFDQFQAKGDRIARVVMEYSMGNAEPVRGTFTSTKVFPAFKEHFPEVENGVRFSESGGLIKVNNQFFEDPGFLFADSTFFAVFSSFPLLEGDPKQALANPNQLVITQSAAKKYFGNQPAMGQTILVGATQTPYTVTAVAADCPTNSQIRFNLLASFSSLHEDQRETYWNANFRTYLLLKSPTSINSLQAKIPAFMKKEMNDPNVQVNFILEPFNRVHLYSPYDAFVPNTDISYIYIASGMALLILLIACFTYVNMSTARSLERSREVGIRKVAGATRPQVFAQFIGESFILASLALLLATGMVLLLLPAFNQLTARDLHLSELLTPVILLSGIGLVLAIALLAGAYPALILSGFQPVKVLKGSFRHTDNGKMIRQSLTVFQFAISAFLLIASFVIQQQFNFIQHKAMGYNREQSVVIRIDSKVMEKIDLLKNSFKENPDIQVVSSTASTPVDIASGYSMRSAAMPSNVNLNVYANPIDDDYLKANQIELIAGNDLGRQDLLDIAHENQDSNYYHFILNESAARELGWTPQEAIGKKMYLDDSRPGEVKGVVKDFHFASLHNPIQSLVLFPENWASRLVVRISGKHVPETIQFMESKWKGLYTHRPFNYRFMDDEFNSMYASEKQTAQVISLFSTVAIILACVGLLGLSAFAVQQRIKEIGVRKVLGASVAGIVWMLTRSFLQLVVIAFALAVPLAWLAARKWLQDFSYRTSIGVDVFFYAAIILTALALLAISLQTIRAALANPVKSLRSE